MNPCFCDTLLLLYRQFCTVLLDYCTVLHCAVLYCTAPLVWLVLLQHRPANTSPHAAPYAVVSERCSHDEVTI